MSFLFGRAKSRVVAELPRQAKESIVKLDGPNGQAKVTNTTACSSNWVLTQS